MPAESLYSPNPLARLERREVSAANDAEAEIARTQRAIRRDILELTHSLDVGRSADAREQVFAAVTKRIAGLQKRLDKVERAALEYTAKEAVKRASESTGVEVKYSPARADAWIGTLAGDDRGKSLAAVFTRRMNENVILSLRNATVAAMRENAVAGGTQKELAKTLERNWLATAKNGEIYQFVDSAGRVWNTKTYIAMQTRTNAMRVYNDATIDTIARATGSDLVRISTGGDPDCRECFPWEGRIISITGKTEGFPTYDEAVAAGCFHPNCGHTIGYVDELAARDEIALQRQFPIKDIENATLEDLDENRYQIDQARYRQKGLTKEEAKIAVDRDNLTDSLRFGLVREDARALVDGMNDGQVSALCPNGTPPVFEPTKKATKAHPDADKQVWNKGSRGGVVHVSRETDLANLLEVCGVAKIKGPTTLPDAEEVKAVEETRQTGEDVPTDAEVRAMPLEQALAEVSKRTPDIGAMTAPKDIATREKRLERARKTYQQLYNAAKAIQAERKLAVLRYGWGSKEVDAIRDKEITAAGRSTRAWKLLKKIRENLDAARTEWAVGLIAHGGESAVVNVGKASKLLPLWGKAKSALERIVAKDVFPSETINVRKINGRAYQRRQDIHLSGTDGVSVFVHETMHFIEEYNRHAQERSKAFLEYRTRGESAQSLKKLTGIAYRRDEVAKKDKFFDPYCGKIYEDRNGRINATEILSMGVERLCRNPISFFQEDREYATFCLNVIRGKM